MFLSDLRFVQCIEWWLKAVKQPRIAKDLGILLITVFELGMILDWLKKQIDLYVYLKNVCMHTRFHQVRQTNGSLNYLGLSLPASLQ